MILLLIAIALIIGLIILYCWKKIDEESFEEKTSKDPAPYFLYIYNNWKSSMFFRKLDIFDLLTIHVLFCSVYVIHFIYLQIISKD